MFSAQLFRQFGVSHFQGFNEMYVINNGALSSVFLTNGPDPYGTYMYEKVICHIVNELVSTKA